MRVFTPTAADRHTTPNAVMTSLVTPSRGSGEISAWTVHMEPGARGPQHAMDREQIWLPLSGAITITANGGTQEVGPGQAAFLPAREVRQIAAAGAEPAEILVCMANGGRATLPETGEVRDIPWAE
ncbi:cupin domain-containing protein [Streptomyces litchfieldiae]|uniref:Cupin domain-containing protein n=1 Tax=Streptomyces litchfieldiae TaxID=3075543 RepID=A0ABU2MNF4_9ACTN|nr:cupin domain-containing protein [Streptomyces sp. DSM 44938]MDT0342189.1 cupin domain-containing protein [Streptomyces sp. DSM 44938]